MSTTRRTVLKGLAAAGLTMAGAPWTRAAGAAPAVAGDTVPAGVTSLVSGGALDAAFVAGVGDAARLRGGAGAESRPLQGLDAATYTGLDALLSDGTPTLLVGLVDDAAATLVLDLVRSAGGRVLSVGHHRVGEDAAARQWAGELGRALATPGAALPASITRPHGTPYVSLRCVI